jgi:hypothetical protein
MPAIAGVSSKLVDVQVKSHNIWLADELEKYPDGRGYGDAPQWEDAIRQTYHHVPVITRVLACLQSFSFSTGILFPLLGIPRLFT